MAFPIKLKQMALFNEGTSFVGETVSITPPKLTRKLEDYRGGGMARPVKVDLGGEALEMEVTYGGPMRAILEQHMMLGVGGVLQRFVGSFQDDSSGDYTAVEIVTRGRHEEVDMGEWKPGEDSEFKVKSQLSYFKLVWDGRTVIEIDVLGMVEVINGVDQMATQRAILGMI